MVCTFFDKYFNCSSCADYGLSKNNVCLINKTNSFYEAQINACTTLILSGGAVYGRQQMKVTGVVINEDDGEPVIGASIVVKGTTIGTITDLDGKI